MKRRSAKPTRDPNAPKRAVVYTRLSDDRGDEGAINHRTQAEGCRRKAEALGMAVVAVFEDNISGDRLERPGLLNALRMFDDGAADVLMAYSFDRLARDQGVQVAIVRMVEEAGGAVLSATEELPEDKALRDFMLSAYTLGGALELVKIRERINRNLDARYRQQGRYKPNQKPPYGYKRVGNGGATDYVENPDEARIIRRIHVEAAAGTSRRQIVAGLDRDGVPTPTGRGRWGLSMVTTILGREVYWTGEYEVWRTKTERDGKNKPYRVERPKEERYVVPFPVLLDPNLAAAARAGAARNVWKSARHDRPQAQGLLRYGGAVCSGCGRALALAKKPTGSDRYACTRGPKGDRPCPTPASIAQPDLDGAIVAWVNEVALDPVRAASTWVETEEPPKVDPALMARLTEAERRVAEVAAQQSTYVQNLGLVTGLAAAAVAEKLNALNGEMGEATAERDKLAAEVNRQAVPSRKIVRRVNPETAVAKAVDRALEAGWAAFRHWLEAAWDREAAADPDLFDELHPVAWSGTLSDFPGRPDRTEAEELAAYAEKQAAGVLPPSAHGSEPCWHAWQAILASLGVTVEVNQAGSTAPRWVARMRLPDGLVKGSSCSLPNGWAR